MRALVTGGGGFLGSRITEALLQRGDQVRIFGRSEYPRLAERGAEIVVGDLCDPKAVNAAAHDVDTVFHTASMTGVWGPREDYFAVNSRGTANIIQGCLLNKVEKLVYTSTPSVVFNGRDIIDGDETLPYTENFLAAYPASKSVAEKMVLEANGWEFVIEEKFPDSSDIKQRHSSTVRRLATCALRPHLIWGPGDPHLVPRLVDLARKRILKCIGDGSNQVSLTYIDNAVAGHILAADRLTFDSALSGQVYFINDREPVLLWPWINDLLARMQIEPVGKKMSYSMAYALGAGMEFVHGLIPRLGEPGLTRFVVEQLAKSHSFSWQKAWRDFGYQPEVDNKTGMQCLVASLQA